MESPVAPGIAPMSGARRRLVEGLRAKGVSDPAVLDAVGSVPRHVFVPTGVAHRAYEDSALPIGCAQTISQPYVHARSLELLKLPPGGTVLEIGAGSGYQTALLARLARHVYSIERVPALRDRAGEALRLAGVTNVSLACGDGSNGWPEHAPYDGIVVGAGSPDIPAPLVEQLADGGHLIVPVGGREEQRLVVVTRAGSRTASAAFDPVRFVPLVGTHGWHP